MRVFETARPAGRMLEAGGGAGRRLGGFAYPAEWRRRRRNKPSAPSAAPNSGSVAGIGVTAGGGVGMKVVAIDRDVMSKVKGARLEGSGPPLSVPEGVPTSTPPR